MPGVSRETIEPLLPAGADPAQLQGYHDLLATEAVLLGLIGPRETPRLWERHLGNSAWPVLPVPGLVPTGSTVVDVGSGAGLPGVVWAIARPDLHLTLIEPLLRRATFLTQAVDQLGLADRVEVIRDRAENLVGARTWDIATARAVAPLDRLLGWTIPLLKPHGILLALKGDSAELEIEQAGPVLERLRVAAQVVVRAQAGAAPTRVIVVQSRGNDLR